jgi:hypothetical protein
MIKAKPKSHWNSIPTWLTTKRGYTVTNFELTNKIYDFELQILKIKPHSAADAGRRFREIRNDAVLLKEWNLSTKEVSIPDKNYEGWLIESYKEPKKIDNELNLFQGV